MGNTLLNRSFVQEKPLNEFLYTIIMEATVDQKKSLPDFFKKNIKTAKLAQSFIEKSSTDQKRELLKHLNIASFFIISPMGVGGNKQFVNIINKYKRSDIQQAVCDAADSGLFVTDDRELAYCLGGLAMAFGSRIYTQNLELRRAANVLKSWPKKLRHHEDYENESNCEIVGKFILYTSLQFANSRSSTGLTIEQLQVLLYFYINKGRYVKHEDVATFFAGIIGNQKIIATIKMFLDGLHLQRSTNWEEREYKITKLGATLIADFRDRILKSFNF